MGMERQGNEVKNHITLFLAISAPGSKTLPIRMIGKDKMSFLFCVKQ